MVSVHRRVPARRPLAHRPGPGRPDQPHPEATIQYSTSWRRHWAPCSLRAFGLPGHLSANNNCGKGAPQSDGYFLAIEMWTGPKTTGHVGQWRYVGWQFTDSAGFGPVGSYTCHRRGQTVTCTTRLGDSFRYTP